MKIGIPKALYYYEYRVLFQSFFEELGMEVVLSHDTDKNIVQNGILKSIDEECLASKIFLGHINNLVSRVESENIDYIFVPRLCTFKNNRTICVKFYALYDICRNLFNANFLTLNIDYEKRESELKAFIKLGKKLNMSIGKITRAYIKAKNKQKIYEISRVNNQLECLNKSSKVKILLVAHSYIYEDKYLGYVIKNYLNKLGVDVFYADVNTSNIEKKELKKMKYKNISNSIYWKQSIDLLNGVDEYLDRVDGIIYLSVFPCGTDSLVNELSIRKIRSVPSMNIILDDEEGTAGICTRLESFVDILESKIKLKEDLEWKKISNI